MGTVDQVGASKDVSRGVKAFSVMNNLTTLQAPMVVLALDAFPTVLAFKKKRKLFQNDLPP